MDWTQVVLAVVGLFGAGSAGYLLIEKAFSRKADQHEAEKIRQEAEKAKLENVNESAEVYGKIREIVVAETRPLEEKIDHLTQKLSFVCCYRPHCERRIRDDKMLTDKDKKDWGEAIEIITKSE